jgi:general L-amino acid transport system permease protein
MTIGATATRIPIWRNVRVIAWAFQLVVFSIVAIIVYWLVGNYRVNTASSGIPTNFNFLDNPARFSIPGSPFDQNQAVRAAFGVGILNTLRISVVGIVMATVIGILVGVGRLSTNWVVNKLSAVYVEVVRNLPLLVILVFVFLGVVLQALPRIENAWSPLGLLVVSNRGIGVPWYQSGSGSLLVLIGMIGIGGWWVLARWRRSVSERTGDLARSGLIGSAFFLSAVVLGWIFLGLEVTLPRVVGRTIAGGIRVDPSYFAVLIALVIYTASHIAEIVRGSIQAVSKGQGEAAKALALSSFQRMWNVILPQAMRVAIPPLGNQYLNLIKNSSLGAGFAYFELTNVTQITVGNGSPAVPAFTLALLFYVVMSLVTSAVVNVANRRFALVER